MGKDIKKKADLLEKQELQIKKGKELNKCNCPHTKKGALDVYPAENRGKLQYTCRRCKKEIDFRKIPEKTDISDGKAIIGLADACNTVDKAIDTIKITLNLETEKDAEILEKLAEVQYRVRNQIVKLYGKALSSNNDKKKNRRDDEDYSSWNKPQISR